MLSGDKRFTVPPQISYVFSCKNDPNKRFTYAMPWFGEYQLDTTTAELKFLSSCKYHNTKLVGLPPSWFLCSTGRMEHFVCSAKGNPVKSLMRIRLPGHSSGHIAHANQRSVTIIYRKLHIVQRDWVIVSCLKEGRPGLLDARREDPVYRLAKLAEPVRFGAI